jgi:hypothetical protein
MYTVPLNHTQQIFITLALTFDHYFIGFFNVWVLNLFCSVLFCKCLKGNFKNCQIQKVKLFNSIYLRASFHKLWTLVCHNYKCLEPLILTILRKSSGLRPRDVRHCPNEGIILVVFLSQGNLEILRDKSIIF